MRNKDIHKSFKVNGVKKWEVSEKLGISDSTFSRKLRKELSQEEKEKIFKAIEEVKNEMETKEVE